MLDGLDYLGVDYDSKANWDPQGEVVRLSTDKSKVKVYIIPTNEELVIARETLAVSKYSSR